MWSHTDTITNPWMLNRLRLLSCRLSCCGWNARIRTFWNQLPYNLSERLSRIWFLIIVQTYTSLTQTKTTLQGSRTQGRRRDMLSGIQMHHGLQNDTPSVHCHRIKSCEPNRCHLVLSYLFEDKEYGIQLFCFMHSQKFAIQQNMATKLC